MVVVPVDPPSPVTLPSLPASMSISTVPAWAIVLEQNDNEGMNAVLTFPEYGPLYNCKPELPRTVFTTIAPPAAAPPTMASVVREMPLPPAAPPAPPAAPALP